MKPPTTPPELLAEIREIDWTVMSQDHWGATFEQATFALYDAVLRPGDTAVDVGANLGHHTYAMSRICGVAGRVFSFEPVPDLLLKAQTHSAHFKDIQWINKAVSSEQGVADFHYFPVEHGWSGFQPKEDVLGMETFMVPVTTLDDEINGPVHLIKLDIEGAEFDALRGASRILREHGPVIIFESARSEAGRQFNYTADEFFEFFEGLGYQIYFISGMPLAPELWRDPTHPWQLVGLHRHSARLPRAMAAMSTLIDKAAHSFSFGRGGAIPDFRGSGLP